MILDEAIKHAEEVAVEQDKLCKRYDDASGYSRSHNEAIRTTEAKRCEKCASEHRQLAEWLKDYKRLKEQEPCDDAISRQAAIEAMEYCDFTKSVNDGLALYKESVVEALKGLPSASGTEKSNKIGHWIKSDAVLIVGYADTENYIKLPAQECSICHKPHIKGYGADFCPNCGAKMSEGGQA